MSEFNDRMSIQRHIVQIINSKTRGPEALFGLSSKAIERWLTNNMIDRSSAISRLLTSVSSTLFFLAAKSQEQVSDEYKVLTADIAGMIKKIEMEIST